MLVPGTAPHSCDDSFFFHGKEYLTAKSGRARVDSGTARVPPDEKHGNGKGCP